LASPRAVNDALTSTVQLGRAPSGGPYFAAFDWVAEETGTYMLHVTSFEAVSTGELVVTRG
jgi:hypothetical protein